MEWKVSNKPVPYEDALAFMDARVAAIAAGEAEECVWLLEHPPLYTAGTSAKDEDLLGGDFPVFKTGRGGQYTYHGPGQRIAYVMLDLKKRAKEKSRQACLPRASGVLEAAIGKGPRFHGESRVVGPDVRQYVCDLEEWIIRSIGEFGIKGERRDGRIGIWVEKGDGVKKGDFTPSPVLDCKIAAIGVRIRRWVTLHGIAINVNPDLSHFSGIVPCGISDAGVTSFADLGVKADMAALDEALKEKFFDIFEN